MEEVLELTKAKPEKRDYSWFVIRKMEHAMEIGGNPVSHICVECLENVVHKKKKTANDWNSAVCKGGNAMNAWLHLERKHGNTKNEGLAALDDRAEKLALGCANKDEHVYLKTIYK